MERNGITSTRLNHEMDQLDAQGFSYEAARLLPPDTASSSSTWVDILYIPSAELGGVAWGGGGDAVWFVATSIDDAYAQFFERATASQPRPRTDGWMDRAWTGIVTAATEEGYEDILATVSVLYADDLPIRLSVDVPNYSSDEIEAWFSQAYRGYRLTWTDIPGDEEVKIGTIAPNEGDVADTACLDGALPPPACAGYFGRLTPEGHIAVLHVEDGAPATRLAVDHLYPVDSKFSSRYEHPMGIVITQAEADRIGLEME